MKTGMVLIKLLGVWAFLWLQAAQLDHTVDAGLEQHHSCLFCKSLSDSTDDSVKTPELHEPVSVALKHDRISHQTPDNVAIDSHAARAPPAHI